MNELYGPSKLQATPSTDQGYSHDQEKCIDQQDEGPALWPGRPHIATGSVQIRKVRPSGQDTLLTKSFVKQSIPLNQLQLPPHETEMYSSI